MDMADDLAYSVHDTEDFHRAALIPWAMLVLSCDQANGTIDDGGEAASLIRDAVEIWWDKPSDAATRAQGALLRLLGVLPLSMRAPYQGTRQQRQELRFWTSTLLGRYVQRVCLASDGKDVTMDDEYHDEVVILKAITLRYAIRNPALAAQQFGQRRILRDLFEDLSEAIKTDALQDMIPVRFRHLAAEWRGSEGVGAKPSLARVAADCIASMTEDEATLLHGRFRGVTVGSVLNPILR